MVYFDIEDFVIDNFNIKVVRDDVFPFIGGGNKARKALEYETFLKNNNYDAIVTTGGIQSNHNRAMALMAARNGWKCHLVYHGSKQRFIKEKGNALLVRLSGATYEFVDAEEISLTMDNAILRFIDEGRKPYYVTGGGHDILGGLAFVDAIQQLYNYGMTHDYKPNYIFHASGTGSTQAGILVGLALVGWSDVKVIGISVARQQERGKQVISDFANVLSKYCNINNSFLPNVIFNTDYLYGGYECYTVNMKKYLEKIMRQTGLIFDLTYSGKALYGMMDIIKANNITGNIIFWHTGGLMNVQK